MNGRRLALPVLLVVVLLVGIVLLAGRPPSTRPLDPGSTKPDGTRALVLLLEALGARVDLVRGAVPDDATAALVLQDRLDTADTRRTREWVEGGGVLVLSDPFTGGFGDFSEAGCDPVLGDVGRLRLVNGADVDRDESCFAGAVQVDDQGSGSVVLLDDASDIFGSGAFDGGSRTTSLFMNDLLDEEDNAVLAADLLAPTDGARVAILVGSRGGDGGESLFGLVGPSLRQATFQLLVVAAVFVLWRGRRLGRPVAEAQPVLIAGSELVAAVGRLLDARRRPDEAAAALRADVRRALELRIGVPSSAPVAAAADAVHVMTGLDAASVADALEHAPVTSDADLIAVTDRLDRIRSLVLGTTPSPRRNP